MSVLCKKRPAPPQPDDDDAKRKKIEDPAVEEKVKVVRKAVNDVPGHSDWCHEMLRSMVPGALSPSRRERDEFQHESVEIIGKALSGLEAQMVTKSNALQTQIQTAPQEAQRLKALEQAAATKQANARQAREAAAEKVSQAQDTTRDAKNKLDDAQTVYNNLKAREAELLGEKESRLDAYRKHFVPLATWEFGAEVKEEGIIQYHLDGLMPFCNRPGFEPSLLAAFPLAVRSHPAKRGVFDRLTVTRMEELLKSEVSEVEARLAEFTPVLDDAVRVATGQLQEAQQAEQKAREELREAVEGEAAADQGLAAAKQKVEEHPGNIEKAKTDLASVEEQLKRLRGGALAAYKWLRDRE